MIKLQKVALACLLLMNLCGAAAANDIKNNDLKGKVATQRRPVRKVRAKENEEAFWIQDSKKMIGSLLFWGALGGFMYSTWSYRKQALHGASMIDAIHKYTGGTLTESKELSEELKEKSTKIIGEYKGCIFKMLKITAARN